VHGLYRKDTAARSLLSLGGVLLCGALLGTACRTKPLVDSGETGDTAGPVDTSPPDDTGPPPPADLDSDGVTDDTDCDDYDPTVYPGADELYDEKDNDCDDRIDANGVYAGSVSGDASAVYEGVSYSFSLDCPTTLQRALKEVDFSALCTTDGSEMALLLLGETVEIVMASSNVPEGTWSGRFEFISSNGWDTDGNGTLTWSGLNTVNMLATLDTFSLDASVSGSVAYDPKATAKHEAKSKDTGVED